MDLEGYNVGAVSMGMMIPLLRLHEASGIEDAGTEAVTDAITVAEVAEAAAEVGLGGRGDDEVVIVVGGRGRGERGGSEGT
jgi:hypothetical protein